MVEQCFRTRKTILNPIVDWTDADVWQFLNHYGCESNPLYKCGQGRIGCIGCPMSSRQLDELNRYPKYKDAYIRAFGKMVAKRKEDGLKTDWNTGEEVFEWWVGKQKAPINLDQITFDDF